MLKNIIDESFVSFLIMPLTKSQTASLENYLYKHVVSCRKLDEFLAILNIEQPYRVNLVAYEVHPDHRFNDEEREKIKTSLLYYGRKWMKKKGLLNAELLSMH